MEHTFLFAEGRWIARGASFAPDGARTPVEGETEVRHLPGKWLYEGVLRMPGPKPAEFHNRYEIVPFSPGARSTHWTSQHASLGALRGRFVVVGAAILSFYATATGRYRGFECLQQRDPVLYSAHGAMLEDDKLISSWALELARA